MANRSSLQSCLLALAALSTALHGSSCMSRKGGDESSLLSEPIQAKSEPRARGMHTSIWTGEGMLVWGGMIDDGAPELSTGGAIYYPGSGKWFKLPKHNHDTRYHHSTVWTGIQMIVWGGVEGNFGEASSTGLMLDMEDEQWFTTSTTDAPSPRTGHTAVWTGERMIVWGGEAKEAHLNDGGVYDLVSDGWEKLAAGGDARSFHTAVWTGKKMIIWGGMSDDGALNSGASFDPKAKTWKPISAKGAPAGRFSHTVVWTGSKMIVWGGRGDNDKYFNDGGIYDPASDTWTKISSDGAPSPRELHSAIWTGSEMVVWGGLNGAGAQGNGGIYTVEDGSWERVKTKRKTPARYMHSAVWTGSELLIWGGRGANGKFLKKDTGAMVMLDDDAPKKSNVKGPKAKIAKKSKSKSKPAKAEDKAPAEDDLARDAAAYLEEMDKPQPAEANSK